MFKKLLLIQLVTVEAVVKLKKAMWGDINIFDDVISKYNNNDREFEANGDWWGGRWPSDERMTFQWQVDNGDMQEKTVNKWERIKRPDGGIEKWTAPVVTPTSPVIPATGFFAGIGSALDGAIDGGAKIAGLDRTVFIVIIACAAVALIVLMVIIICCCCCGGDKNKVETGETSGAAVEDGKDDRMADGGSAEVQLAAMKVEEV